MLTKPKLLNQAQKTLAGTQSQLKKLKTALKRDRSTAASSKQLDDLDEAKLAGEQDRLQGDYIDQLQAMTTHNQKQYLEKNQQRATSENHKRISGCMIYNRSLPNRLLS